MRNKMDGPGRSKKKKRKQGVISTMASQRGQTGREMMKGAIERKKEYQAKTKARAIMGKASERTNTLKNLKPPM